MDNFGVLKVVSPSSIHLYLKDAGFEADTVGLDGFVVVRYESQEKLAEILNSYLVKLFQKLDVKSLHEAHDYVAKVLEKVKREAEEAAELEIFKITKREILKAEYSLGRSKRW